MIKRKILRNESGFHFHLDDWMRKEKRLGTRDDDLFLGYVESGDPEGHQKKISSRQLDIKL